MRSGRSCGVAPFGQHCVTVAVEAISMLDRVGVRAADVLSAGERGDEHEQCRFWKMEVGDQAVDDSKTIARGDEESRLAALRFEAGSARGFERAQGRRADGED